MDKLLGFLSVLIICAVQGLAQPTIGDFNYDYEEFEDEFGWLNDAGRPSTSTGRAKCKKDLLLIVDTSYSIGPRVFENDVKPFLKNLINDRVLNVDRDGTHLALVVFSAEKRTKILLNFGDKYEPEQLTKFVDGLSWNKIRGGSTRTDLALKLANKVFPEENPTNNRPDVDDTVILITDGEPTGVWNTKKRTYDQAKILKEKGVLVVGAAVGPNRKKFRKILEKVATSSKYVLDADFQNMDKILSRLVASSCVKPGECTCHDTKSATVYVKPGHTTATVHWPVPKFACKEGMKPKLKSLIVQPQVKSPHAFPPGKHTIRYTFKLRGNVNVVCPVTFDVRGEKCRGVIFDSLNEVCCCSKIHRKKPSHACCGPDYYHTGDQRCCPNANLISREMSCPIHA